MNPDHDPVKENAELSSEELDQVSGGLSESPSLGDIEAMTGVSIDTPSHPDSGDRVIVITG